MSIRMFEQLYVKPMVLYTVTERSFCKLNKINDNLIFFSFIHEPIFLKLKKKKDKYFMNNAIEINKKYL